SKGLPADDKEIGKTVAENAQPDLFRPVKIFFHGNPVEMRKSFRHPGDPFPVAGAEFDSQRERGIGEFLPPNRSIETHLFMAIGGEVEAFFEKDGAPLAPCKRNLELFHGKKYIS